VEKLGAAGVTTVEALADMTPEQLEAIEGIGPKTVEKISLAVNNYFASLEQGEAVEGVAEGETAGEVAGEGEAVSLESAEAGDEDVTAEIAVAGEEAVAAELPVEEAPVPETSADEAAAEIVTATTDRHDTQVENSDSEEQTATEAESASKTRE
jgi:N utilization substance protein A